MIAGVLDRVTFETAESEPSAGTDAHRLWRGRNPGYALDGFITMQYANMSGLDHVRAFATLIRAPAVRSTALATVTRGALESLARTWHLLSRTTDDDFLYRVICLMRSDLRYSELLNEQLQTRDGDPVDPVQKRVFLLEELSRLELPAPARNDISAMVASMLDAEFEGGEGREIYSSLSSIAHAHRLGLNTFVVTDERGEIAGLSAPRAVVADMAVRLIGAMNGTAAAFILLYGNKARHRDLLETALQRALRSIEPITASMWPDDS